MVQQVVNVGTNPGDGTGDSGQVPFNKTNSNFTELYSTALYFGTDSGSANAYAVLLGTLKPLPIAFPSAAGTTVRFVPNAVNTGPSTFNGTAIIGFNGLALTGGELSPTGPVVLQFNGTAWQLVATAGAQAGLQRTAAEVAASVIPVDYTKRPGIVTRYALNTTPGTTDMTVGFTAAVAQAAQTGGVGEIYAPAGQYLVQAGVISINSRVWLHGDGNDTVIIPKTGTTGALISFTNVGSSASNTNAFGQLYGVLIENFLIFDTALRTVTADGINIIGCDQFTLRKVWVRALNGYALKLDSGAPVRESWISEFYAFHCGNTSTSKPQIWIHNTASGDSHNELFLSGIHSIYPYERALVMDGAGSQAVRFVFINGYQFEGMAVSVNGTQNTTITNITQAASAVVTLSTVSASNPFVVGDQAFFSGVVGMTQINALYGAVTATGGSSGAWTITVNINSSAFTAYSSGGNAQIAPAPFDLVQVLIAQSGIYFQNGTAGNVQGFVSGVQAGYTAFRLGNGNVASADIQSDIRIDNSYIGDGFGGVGIVVNSARDVFLDNLTFGSNPGGYVVIGNLPNNSLTVTNNAQNGRVFFGLCLDPITFQNTAVTAIGDTTKQYGRTTTETMQLSAFNAVGGFSARPSATVTGAFLYNDGGTTPRLTLVQSGNTANNRIADLSYSSTTLTLAYATDSLASSLPLLVAVGGQAAGLTSLDHPNGPISFSGAGTTASAANAFLDNTTSPANRLLRSTSSLRYKTQVEPLEKKYSDNLLRMRPVWYRSLCEADRKEWSWYGLIAEEVAQIDPRLVHWEKDETGNLIPDAVQYERLTVLLLAKLKEQETRISDLERRGIV